MRRSIPGPLLAILLCLPAQAEEAPRTVTTEAAVTVVTEPTEEPLGPLERAIIGGVILSGAFAIGMFATGSLATGIGVASAVAISYSFLP